MQHKDNELKASDSLSHESLPILAATFYVAFTLISFGLVLWSIDLLTQSFSVSLLLLMLVVSGMTYDNFVLSIGYWIKESRRLELLHRLRFLIHQLFIPTLVVAVVKVAQQADIDLMKTPSANDGSWAIAAGLILFGMVSTDCFRSELRLVRCAGALHYFPRDFSPLPAILTTVLVTAVGANFWLNLQCPWVLLSGLLVLVANTVPTSLGGGMISAAVELGLMAAILATARIVL